MTDWRSMERRSYLALAGLAASGTLAGCGGDDGPATGDGAMDDTSADGNESTADGNSDNSTSDGGTNGSGDPLEVRNFLVPESAQVGEEVQIRGRVTNSGEEMQVYTSTVYLGFSDHGEPDEWEEIPVETPVGPGSVVEWSIEPFTPERPSRIFARLGEDGDPKIIDVPPERAPYITDAIAVSEGQEVEDFESAGIESVPAGSTIGLAFRYWFYSENQTLDARARILVFGPSGAQVGQIIEPTQQSVEESGWNMHEATIPVATEGADPGEYTLELALVDQQSDAESETAFVDIELTGDQTSE